MINAIKNIKTEKTEKQKDNEWKSVIGHKTLLLNSTDWTQLEDVFLSNKDEFVKWRRNLRKTDLKKIFDSPEQAEDELNKVEARKPIPIFSKTVKPDNVSKLEKEVRDLNILVHQLANSMMEKEEPKLEKLNLSDSHKKIIDLLIVEKNEVLISLGALTLPILTAQTDQAIDFLSRNQASLSDYSLLDNDTNDADTQFVQKIIDSFKQKRKELYKIELDYLQKIESVYNMPIEEVNNYFIEYGHRYRCVE